MCAGGQQQYAWASDAARVEYQNRYFFYISVEELKEAREANLRAVKRVPGTQKFHSVRSTTQPNTIQVRDRGCCCQVCMAAPYGVDNTGECKNSAFTTPWRTVELTSATGADEELVLEMEEQHHHRVAEGLEVGDVFAIAAINDEDDFRLLRVDVASRQCTAEDDGKKDWLGQQVFTNEWFITASYLEYSDDKCTAYVVDASPERRTFSLTQSVRFGPINMGVNTDETLFVHPDDLEVLLDATEP